MVPEASFGLPGEGKEHHCELGRGGERAYRAGQRVNSALFRKLYSEYIDFKASIYCLLCYVYLCKREWTKTIRYASTYQEFEKQYQLQAKSAAQQQVYYNVLTYKMEAQSELGRSHKAYDLMQDLINSIEYAESIQLQARSTPNERKP